MVVFSVRLFMVLTRAYMFGSFELAFQGISHAKPLITSRIVSMSWYSSTVVSPLCQRDAFVKL